MLDRPHVEVHTTKFSGTPKFYENGTAYRDIDQMQPVYAGIPKPEIDEAWDELIGRM
jgi:hypothetical protein